MLACIQISAFFIGLGWNAFFGYVSHVFVFGFLDVSPRSKSVRLMIAVSVNISNCLNRVYIAVPDSFPVRILERTSV